MHVHILGLKWFFFDEALCFFAPDCEETFSSFWDIHHRPFWPRRFEGMAI